MLKNEFKKSSTKSFFDKLFVGGKEYRVSESLVGRATKSIYLPHLSEVCLALSVVLFWYEGLLSKYLPFLANNMFASLLLVFALIFARKDNIVFSKMHFWYLGFLVLSLFSAVFAAFQGINVNLLISGWLLFVQFGLAIFVAQSIDKKTGCLKGLVFLSLPLAAAGIYQFAVREKTSSLWLSPFETGIDTRAFAFFGSPNVLGILLAIIAIITLGFYIKEKKLYYLAITLADVLAVGFTFSRSAWLGLLAGLVVMALFIKPKLVIFSPAVFLLLLIPQVRNRIEIASTGKYLTDSSLDGRIWSFINSKYIFEKYPIFGSGPGSYGGKVAAENASPIYLQSIQNGYTALYFTDNQFLEVLVQAGLLGFVAFLGFVVAVFVNLIAKFKKNKDIVLLASLASFICFLVSGLFANVLEYGAVVVPMGVILGSVLSEK